MTTKRLAILVAAVLGGCALVFALPRQLGYQPTGILLALPEFAGSWWGHEVAVSQRERSILGLDTDFARKFYDNGIGGGAQVSIVLSGQDMMTSIHRPERCLLAQGWSPSANASATKTIDVPGFGPLGVTRLRNYRVEQIAPDPKKQPPGSLPATPQVLRHESICYYWFVGYTDLATTHEERVFLDLRDRVMRGYNQRWAMVLVFSEVTKHIDKFGRDEAQTDALLNDLVSQLAPKILRPSLQRHVSSASAAPKALAAAEPPGR